MSRKSNGPRHDLQSDRKRNDEYKLSLFAPKNDNDWTQSIHHQLHIKRRTCTTFIPNAKSTGDRANLQDTKCGCNRRRREHSWDYDEGDDPPWDQKKHTKAAYNNAFGRLPNTHAPYIRCDIDTRTDVLAKLMFDVWHVRRPRLLLCIIGGAKYFKLNERLQKEFIKGIIQAALIADGWIITSGFKTGVVQLVGEAIHENKLISPKSQIIAVACSKWGSVKNRESLIIKKPSKESAAASNATKKEKGQQDLEPNHTHFLLLDDGTYYNYETGDYRTRFVTEIARHNNQDVPIVTIVVEGGPDTLMTIYNDLRCDIPVVLIDGSGRVPNLLAKFLTRTESMINRGGKKSDSAGWQNVVDIQESEKLKTYFLNYEEEIRTGLKDISKGSRTSEKEMNNLFILFLYCLQPAVRSQILVYSLNSDHDLDDTIFEAIIQAKQKKSSETNTGVNREQMLDLALAWDAIEVAKEHIIKDDLSDLTAEVKEKLLFKALRLDRPEFVNSFIKLNFDLPSMFYERKTNQPWRLKWDQLRKLFDDDEKKRGERLYLLAKFRDTTHPINTEQELDRTLRKLIGDYMKPLYTQSPVGLMGRFLTCWRCPNIARVADNGPYLYSHEGDDDSEVPDPIEAEKEVRELVYRDLFLWAILTNRIEMAKVVLSYMQTRICAALIASKVFKSFLPFAPDNETKEVLSSQADQFESYANEFLKCCYNFDEGKACEIAIRRINLFGAVSCLQVAVDADDKSFVGQPCCDQLLNNIWYDKIDPFQTQLRKRFLLHLSIWTFGLFAPFLVTFRKEQPPLGDINRNHREKEEMIVNETEEEKQPLILSTRRLNQNCINYSDSFMWRSNRYSRPFMIYFRHLKHFHEAPMVKFSYTCVSYLLFLLFFSYYMLFNFNIPTNDTPSIHWTEILVIVIVSTMFIEEVRQFLCQDNRSVFGKFSNYFLASRVFNIIGVVAYILFYVGLILRFENTSSYEAFAAAKIALAYDLELWFIRSLAFVGIEQKLGPKLVMIRKMIIDLFFFTYIIIVVMTAYGVASRSMYQYNNPLTFSGLSIFQNIIYPVYYFMYGSFDGERSQLDENAGNSTAIATQVLLSFHMLFVNILLINLLIAMFSFTFDAVQSHTDLVWRYERYSLIREYFDRPTLFPPLIFITHVIELIKLCWRHWPSRRRGHRKKTQAKTFKMVAANQSVDKDWSDFESYATNLYARSLLTAQPSSASILAPSIARQEVQQQQQPPPDTTSNIPQPLVTGTASANFDVQAINEEVASIRKVVIDLRTHAEEMNTCMQWMMNAMTRVKMSNTPQPRLKSGVTTQDRNQTDDAANL